MIHWTDKFATGDALIDSQHRMLISYINRLEELSRITNPSREQVEQFWAFIEFMEGYVKMHFQDEDACMYRTRCPAYQVNKKMHGEFLVFFRNFLQRLDAEGCRPAVVKELYDYCSVWVQQHILRIDTQLRLVMPTNSAKV